MTLQDAVMEEMEKLIAFKKWYSLMNIKEPEKFPLDILEDNQGVWYEMIQDFDVNDPDVIALIGES